jgi:hypothetical protein
MRSSAKFHQCAISRGWHHPGYADGNETNKGLLHEVPGEKGGEKSHSGNFEKWPASNPGGMPEMRN